MIPNWVITRVRRGASNKQDPSFTVNVVGEILVAIKPELSLLIPVGDLETEGVGGVGIELRVGRGVVGIVGVLVGSDLGENAVGLFDEVLVFGLGFGGNEVADADGATEDEDGDEAAEDGDFDVVEGFLDLATAGGGRGAGAAAAVGGGGGKWGSDAALLGGRE